MERKNRREINDERWMLEDVESERIWIDLINKQYRTRKLESTYKGIGSFIKTETHTFRTEAYIQWGESEEIIGTVLMLNPGSAKLLEEKIENNTFVEGELKIDDTMKALIEVVTELYSEKCPLEGKLYIYNLFPLQESEIKEAIKEFKQLWKENEYFVKNFPKDEGELQQQLKQSPWIWIGWGCEKGGKELELLKDKWERLIEESGTPRLGVVGKRKGTYYHPKPQINSKRLEVKEEIKKQYKEIIEGTR